MPAGLEAPLEPGMIVAIVAVVVSRREKVAADYFLAGRNLPWWLIGISLIASNISTEQLVGQAGQGMDFGLAVAAYEWMSAITLIIVARWFLPAAWQDVYHQPGYPLPAQEQPRHHSSG